MKFHVTAELISSFPLQNSRVLITSFLSHELSCLSRLYDNTIQLIHFSDFLIQGQFSAILRILIKSVCTPVFGWSRLLIQLKPNQTAVLGYCVTYLPMMQ